MSKINDEGQKVAEFYSKINEQKWISIIDESNPQNIGNIFNALAKINDQKTLEEFYLKSKSYLPNFIDNCDDRLFLSSIFLALADKDFVEDDLKDRIIQKYFNSKNFNNIKNPFLSKRFFKQIILYDQKRREKQNLGIFSDISESMSIDDSDSSLSSVIKMEVQPDDEDTKMDIKSDESIEQVIDSHPERIQIYLTKTGLISKKHGDLKYSIDDQKLIRSIALIKNFKDVLSKNSLIYCGPYYCAKVGDSAEKITQIDQYDLAQHTIIIYDLVVKFNEESPLKNELTSKDLLDSNGKLRKIFSQDDLDQGEINFLLENNFLKKIHNHDKYILLEEDDIYQKLIGLKGDPKEQNKKDVDKIIEKIRSTKLENVLELIDQSYKKELEKQISNPKNHYLRYYDPNKLDIICEVSWDKFKEREFDAKKNTKSVSRYKAISSLQHKGISDSIKQEGSTCFLIALNCLNEDDYILKECIDFIHKKENEKITDIIEIKDAINNPQEMSVISKFSEKLYISGDSDANPKLHLQNIFIDMDEPDTVDFLKRNLNKKVFELIINKYNEYQQRFLLSSKFVLQKYCEFIKYESQTSFDKESLYADFEKYKQQNLNIEIKKLSNDVFNLYRKVAQLNQLKPFDYEYKLDIDISLIDAMTENKLPSTIALDTVKSKVKSGKIEPSLH